MKVATVRSRCECQAKLGAELYENKLVRRGWALDPRRGVEENAPAHTIGADKDHFSVAWHCPRCIRNTLRSFDTSGLSWSEVAGDSPAQAEA